MPGSVSNQSHLLKTVYSPYLIRTWHDHVMISNWLNKENDFTQGTTYSTPIVLGSVGGQGSRAIQDNLPRESSSSGTTSTLSRAVEYQEVEFDGASMVTMGGNTSGSYVDLKTWTMQEATRAFARYCDIQLNGTGLGFLARINDASPTSGPITIDSPFGRPTTESNDDAGAVRLFWENQFIHFINPSSGALRSGTTTESEITSRDYANNTITLDATPTDVVNNDFIVIEGDTDGAGVAATDSNTVMGLLGAADDGTIHTTFQGVNTSTFPQFKATVKGSATSMVPFDMKQLRGLRDQIGTRSGMEMTPENVALYCSYTVESAISEQAIQANRGKLGEATLGNKKVPMLAVGQGEHPLMLSYNCAPNRIFILPKQSLCLKTTEEPHWVDEDGSTLRSTAGAAGSRKDAWFGFARRQGQLAVKNDRQTIGVLQGIGTE